MAHAYSALYGIPTTGLRFFTVYGPYGRPDMALFIFTKAILEGKPIEVYNNGDMKRDFTYIDDIVEGIIRLITTIPKPNPGWDAMRPDPATSFAPYAVYNIGNNQPVQLLHFIELIEKKLGRKADKKLMSIQRGDVPENYADVDALMKATGFKPSTPIEEGVAKFIDWYLDYYKNASC
jgi:UDP-glucuronate 4-epimerase